MENLSKRRFNDADTDNSSNDGDCHSSPNTKRIKLERDEESKGSVYSQNVKTDYSYSLESKIKREHACNIKNEDDQYDDLVDANNNCISLNNDESRYDTINNVDEDIHIDGDETLVIENYDMYHSIRNWASNCGVDKQDLMKLLDILQSNEQTFCLNKSSLEVTQISRSHSDEFEKKVLEELKNIKKSQEKTLKIFPNVKKKKTIQFTSDDDDVRRNWFSEYNIYLPIKTIAIFNQFCKLLDETEQFRTRFMSFIDVIAKPDKYVAMSRKISVVIKSMMIRDVAKQFIMVRPIKDKIIVPKTKFYDCLFDYFSTQLKTNEKNPQKTFNSAFKAAIANAKDWGNRGSTRRYSF